MCVLPAAAASQGWVWLKCPEESPTVPLLAKGSQNLGPGSSVVLCVHLVVMVQHLVPESILILVDFYRLMYQNVKAQLS